MFLVLRWFLIGLIAPGVGFWRAGKPHLAIAAGLSLLPLPAVLFVFSFAPLKFAWLLIIAVVVWVGATVVQAALGALAARKPVVRWPAVLGFALGVMVLNNLSTWPFKARLVPFTIPSEAMSPTLIAGDQFYVLRDRERFPIERGAVIVHHDQERGVDYVKRIVGIGGDTVTWDGEVLTINGTALSKGPCEPDALSGCHTEKLGRRRWRVLTTDARALAGTWEVPEGYVFALGDNRDNSFDSRSVGPIPLESVKGVAQIIHFSWPHVTRIGRPLDPAE